MGRGGGGGGGGIVCFVISLVDTLRDTYSSPRKSSMDIFPCGVWLSVTVAGSAEGNIMSLG